MADKVNSAQFDQLIAGDRPVVCDFFATWCGPCKMLAPVMEQVAAENAAKATFVKVDVDECPDLASRYGIRCQGADEIALTKLDVLDGYEEIEICTHYELDGKVIDEFPFTDVLDECKPVFEKVKGWNCDITGCRRAEDLPKEALDYIRLLENLCGCKIKYVSVGAERDACIVMD